MISGLPHLLPQLPCHQWQHLLSQLLFLLNPKKPSDSIEWNEWPGSTQVQESTESQYIYPAPVQKISSRFNIQSENIYWELQDQPTVSWTQKKTIWDKSKSDGKNIENCKKWTTSNCRLYKGRSQDRDRPEESMVTCKLFIQSCLL